MLEKTFCGYDPGISGAITFLIDTTNVPIVVDVPTMTIGTGRRSKKTGKEGTKRIIDFYAIKKLFLKYQPVFTVVEKLQIGGKPGAFSQSAQSIATTHYNGGFILGLLFGLGISYEEVTAPTWQKEFFRKSRTDRDTKVASYECCRKLYPKHIHLLRGKRGAIKDGRCDSLLLSLYARRRYLGSLHTGG